MVWCCGGVHGEGTGGCGEAVRLEVLFHILHVIFYWILSMHQTLKIFSHAV